MASIKPPRPETGEQETLLEFPCKFPVKAMGRSEDGFEDRVARIILSRASVYEGEPITTNSSDSGKYTSVTVTIEALSKIQLDQIYQDLTDCEQVLVAL
jgi:putative lipoic acid-binding regulatory protein